MPCPSLTATKRSEENGSDGRVCSLSYFQVHTEKRRIRMKKPHRSQPDLAVLHALRCIGFETEPRVASASGMASGELARRLRTLTDLGLVEHTPGLFGGWGLTDTGRTKAQELLADELELPGARHLRDDERRGKTAAG
jgi:hypothetical protein